MPGMGFLEVTNPFEAHGQRTMNGADRARERREQKKEERAAAKLMVPSPLERKMQEQAELLKRYRAWRRSLKASIVERHGRDFAELMRTIRALEWGKVQAVVDYVAEAWWLRRADEETRLATLSYIDHSIIRARIRAGLPPIDDGMFDEVPAPPIVIRRLLMGH